MVPLKRCTATHVPRPKVLQRQCYRELMQAEHFGILQAPDSRPRDYHLLQIHTHFF